MAKYVIEEHELLSLITDSLKLVILENDGVDNWSWYMEGYNDFIENAGLDPEENDLYDVAMSDLDKFQKIEG